MGIYFKTDLALDDLAGRLRGTRSLPEQDRTLCQRDQKRVGSNFGGRYYLFGAFGLALSLLHNQAEVAIPEQSDFAYSLSVEAHADADRDTLDCLTRRISTVMRSAGLDVTLDALAA